MSRGVPLIVPEEQIPLIRRALLRALREVSAGQGVQIEETDEGLSVSLGDVGGSGTEQERWSSGVLPFDNQTGNDLVPGQVIGISNAKYTSDKQKLRRRRTMVARTPTEDDQSAFGVVLTSTKNGRMGKAQFSGVVAVQISGSLPVAGDMVGIEEGSHFAELDEEGGTARTLWAGSLGDESWAIIVLGAASVSLCQKMKDFPGYDESKLQILAHDTSGDCFWIDTERCVDDGP